MASPEYVLLLTPCFSRYDILEGGIINIYLRKSMVQAGYANPVMLNLIPDTPYLLYQQYGLYNPAQTLIDPSAPENRSGTAFQQVILMMAFAASVINHVANATLVCVVGNGPVPNDGFSAIMGYAATIGKPVVYWKDDARHLWGSSDNPLSLGLLPNISDHLLSPAMLTIRLNKYVDKSINPTNCGDMVFPDMIKRVMAGSKQPQSTTYPINIQNMIDLGGMINSAFAPDAPDGITYGTMMADTLKAYNKLKAIITTGKGWSLVSPVDQQFLSSLMVDKIAQTPAPISEAIRLSKAHTSPPADKDPKGLSQLLSRMAVPSNQIVNLPLRHILG